MKKLVMRHGSVDVLESIRLNGGYCISVKEKTDATKCMCEYAKKRHKCRCGLYETVEVDGH